MSRPKVGVACIVKNQNGDILLGKRISGHASGFYTLPGGHLEFGEEITQCARRELEEETGLIVPALCCKVIGFENTIYRNEGKHYIVIFVEIQLPSGQKPVNTEPEKIDAWKFYAAHGLPEPLMAGIVSQFKRLNYGPC